VKGALKIPESADNVGLYRMDACCVDACCGGHSEVQSIDSEVTVKALNEALYVQ